MNNIHLSILRLADRKLVEVALELFGGEVVAIEMPPMQAPLPLAMIVVPTKTATRRRKAQRHDRP